MSTLYNTVASCPERIAKQDLEAERRRWKLGIYGAFEVGKAKETPNADNA